MKSALLTLLIALSPVAALAGETVAAPPAPPPIDARVAPVLVRSLQAQIVALRAEIAAYQADIPLHQAAFTAKEQDLAAWWKSYAEGVEAQIAALKKECPAATRKPEPKK